jgi:hypothetical protein
VGKNLPTQVGDEVVVSDSGVVITSEVPS